MQADGLNTITGTQGQRATKSYTTTNYCPQNTHIQSAWQTADICISSHCHCVHSLCILLNTDLPEIQLLEYRCHVIVSDCYCPWAQQMKMNGVAIRAEGWIKSPVKQGDATLMENTRAVGLIVIFRGNNWIRSCIIDYFGDATQCSPKNKIERVYWYRSPVEVWTTALFVIYTHV